ncbi:MAG: ribbon-helix-helix protein, CopG family [Coraliomargarita sp.]|nr:ribbon-helix-helix protein, CopG family [Coraliomargarita sp.]
MRTIVDIPDELVASLDRIREERGCSRAAVIREALESYAETLAVEEIHSAYGLWRNRKKEGVSYQKELREEWGEE